MPDLRVAKRLLDSCDVIMDAVIGLNSVCMSDCPQLPLGINTLISIMSRLGRKEETASEINHYERLEFLGDAVVEFMSSIHLYYMFPSLEEGGLATYRAAIVQNQHLAVLAKVTVSTLCSFLSYSLRVAPS